MAKRFFEEVCSIQADENTGSIEHGNPTEIGRIEGRAQTIGHKKIDCLTTTNLY